MFCEHCQVQAQASCSSQSWGECGDISQLRPRPASLHQAAAALFLTNGGWGLPTVGFPGRRLPAPRGPSTGGTASHEVVLPQGQGSPTAALPQTWPGHSRPPCRPCPSWGRLPRAPRGPQRPGQRSSRRGPAPALPASQLHCEVSAFRRAPARGVRRAGGWTWPPVPSPTPACSAAPSASCACPLCSSLLQVWPPPAPATPSQARGPRGRGSGVGHWQVTRAPWLPGRVSAAGAC